MLRYVSKRTMRWTAPCGLGACLPTSLTLPAPWSARFKSSSACIADEFPDHPVLNSCVFDFPFDGAEYNLSNGRHKYNRRVADWATEKINISMGAQNRVDHEHMAQLIALLSVRNYYQEAIEVLQFARNNGAKPHISAYSQVIASCYAHQRYDEALQVFDVMRRDGYRPSFVTYSRALSAASKAEYHDMTLNLFDDLFNDCDKLTFDSISIACNIVLHSCGKHEDYKTATDIWQQMTDENIPKSTSTYTAFLLCAINCKQWDGFYAILDEATTTGVELYSQSYLSMIQSCARAKRWELVVHIHHKLVSQNLQLSGIAIGAVLMAYTKQGAPERSIEIYNQVLAQGAHLNTYAVSGAVTAYLHLGEYDKAIALCDKWPAAGMLYKLKVQLLIATGSIDDALELLDAKKHLMDRTASCYRPLIAYFLEKRMYDQAVHYSLVLFETNRFVAVADWTAALSAAIALPDKSHYWTLRNWIETRAPDYVPQIPDELLLERRPREAAATPLKLLSPRRPLKLL
ncbi:hypothetical protein SPRG_19976 [Saprolegnia parasitica CBS 223.65]|uniref:Pentacotripeptide-repeat region of PRORP domain-containing protein n=1 Tax=Saprolegnia parasitica (strain CBS 223.65) TaxID=695850 RepID=A0A067CPN7_SAPPC|nr:hypothetical protein SPRG_19976 [Saprolegnia parasitica CBS 223.65]KDO28762.1 hypothetical protein SPRG_19976 [Saprolegnia parasitica CBS 223.65]|eukprot:XP_012200508.1 hypothetical protein SPRG_19976 [Saprolegnia parasitica CBS 223.65]